MLVAVAVAVVVVVAAAAAAVAAVVERHCVVFDFDVAVRKFVSCIFFFSF